jgi:2-(1,2-epoxy-1,2-dihydrophenyl)acetyl-CoA isomerase
MRRNSMNNMTDTLQFSQQSMIATITLNRPDVLNAIDLATADALRSQLSRIEQAPDIRAVILTGSGRAFCAGGDLRFAVATNPTTPGESFLALTDILNDCIRQIRTMAKPVIAAINGPAAGAGFFLALACDLRVMADDTYLKQANTSHGLSIPAGGTFTLPRLVGLARALEIAMLDERIPAQQALDLGLVTRVVPPTHLLAEAEALADRLAHRPVAAIGRVKQLMNETFHSSLTVQLEREQQAIVDSANSNEGRAGIKAFLEKQPLDFTKLRLSGSGFE